MTRVSTEARSRTAAEWITSSVSASRRYRPPTGSGLRRKQLRRARKEVAGRYYQLLSGHAAIGPCLCDKIRKTGSDGCWWCDGGERQSRHHLFARCKAGAPQREKMWGDRGKACRWKHPRAPSAALEGRGSGGGAGLPEEHKSRTLGDSEAAP